MIRIRAGRITVSRMTGSPSSPRRAPILVLLGAVLVGTAAVTGCSSSGGGSKPAVCSSVGDLKASVSKLTDVKVSAGGITTLKADLTEVKKNLQKVRNDAKSQYSTQVDRVRADLTNLRQTASAATSNPSGNSLTAVATAISTLSKDVKALADDISSTC
jgi:outer membrane murein-binding lipoprotein Lpp